MSNQVSGVIFQNAIVLTAGSTLNEIDYPPRSGSQVATPEVLGDPLIFSLVGGGNLLQLYVTYSAPVTLSFFDEGGSFIGSVATAPGCTGNLAGSSCQPNELVSWAGLFHQASLSSAGDFVIDDLSYATAVPEPATAALLTAALLLLASRRRRGWLMALAAACCWAAPQVQPPSIAPLALPIQEPVPVTAACRVVTAPGDPALLANGLTLQRIDRNGTLLATIGVMADDGQNGDAVAGDSIYTRRFTATEAAPGEIRLRCSGAFQGVARRVLSTAGFIPVFNPAPALLNDRIVSFQAAAELPLRRQTLIQHLWGAGGFPAAKLPAAVAQNVTSPVAGLTNLARVDRLDFVPAFFGQNSAHHFLPAINIRPRLVILHHGHACTFDDKPPGGSPPDSGYGMQRTIDALLLHGYSVLTASMPRMPGDLCAPNGHYNIYAHDTGPGSPMRFYMEHLAASLNYFQTQFGTGLFPQYDEFHMVGFSGGGWTATVYSAIDPRIRFSFDAAGTAPLYLRAGQPLPGDIEQTDAAFYALAGYPDLYVLGTTQAAGRRRIQVVNRNDNCCFGASQHNATVTGLSWDQALLQYQGDVQAGLMRTGYSPTLFRVVIDETSPAHTISAWNIASVILAELNGPR